MSPAVDVLVCRVCAAEVPVSEAFGWRCPNSSATDRRHVLAMPAVGGASFVAEDNPFVAFADRLVWSRFAAAHGVNEAQRRSLIDELDRAIAGVSGHGFRWTPVQRADALSAALGFSDAGGVWLKDETNNVGGSHKARHLWSILAHLIVVERHGAPSGGRQPLAIASCGNAAIAAATLAAAVEWPIDVFIPVWADDGVVRILDGLGARTVRCPRRDEDPPGDPCVFRFREAVEAGSIPFSVQGTENVWCLDGGRTLGWEMAAQASDLGLDHVVAQTGGGAFGSCLFAGLRQGGSRARLHVVQSAACAPFDRALATASAKRWQGHEAEHWAELMTVWSPIGDTAATGILDDETYDWLSLLEEMVGSDGTSIVVDERSIDQAVQLTATTGIAASPTGVSGLAGVIARRADGSIGADERVGVVISGVAR